MDMKSKLLMTVTSVTVIFYFCFTFYKTIIEQDFKVISEESEQIQ